MGSNLPNWLQGEEPLPPEPPKRPPKKSGFNPLALAGGLLFIFVAIAVLGAIVRTVSPAAPSAPPESAAIPADTSPVATFAIVTWTVDPSIPTATPVPTSTPEPTATPEPTPAPTLSPVDALAAALQEELGESNLDDRPRLRVVDSTPGLDTLFIDWNINDSFAGDRQATVQIDLARMMRVLVEGDDFIAYKDVAFRGYYPLINALGNVNDTLVVQAWYDRTTLEQINWDNFLHKNTFVIAKTLRLHDNFKD